MKKFIYSALTISVLSFSACLKDNGNYEYNEGNPVGVSLGKTSFTAMVDEPYVLEPIRDFKINGKKTSDYKHEWYVSGELVSTDSTLVYVGPVPAQYSLNYVMQDVESGVKYFSNTATFNVTSPYQTGWGILYEKNGESELAHIRFDGENYINYMDLYKDKNDGESLGSKPMKLKNYPHSGTWSLVVVQQGGQGPVELNSLSLKKELVTKEAFVGGAPANISPINIGSYPNAHFMLNSDGNVYARFFSNAALPFSMPWLNIPLSVPGGMRVRDLWNTHSQQVLMNFMYDELNNRILHINLSEPNVTAGVGRIDTLPSPVASRPYPPDFVNLNRMGDWEYVWGGSMGEAPNSGSGIVCNGVVLMRKPGDAQIYLQSFEMRSVNRVYSHTPKVRIPFTGSALVNADTKYVGIKARNYIFFSGGASNQDLYYFDIVTGLSTKLYANVGSRITAMTQSDNSLQLAVGLENGTVILYDISDATLVSGQSKELHRITGLGTIADISVKGGLMR